jgi:hypothetical protein
MKVGKLDGSCTMKNFPVTVPGENDAGAFTYTGNLTLEAANGSILSAGRVFLQ